MFDTESCFSASDGVQYVFFESELNDRIFPPLPDLFFVASFAKQLNPFLA